MGLKRIALRLFPILAAVLLAAGCVRDGRHGAANDERVVLSDGWLSMGSFFEADLRVKPSEIPVAKTWLAWARVELVRLEAVYSRHDSASQLSDLNRILAQPAALEQGAAIGPALEAVLGESIEIWQATGGAFDVTVGPLVEIWRRAGEKATWPSVESLRKAKGRVGSERLRLLGDGRLGVTSERVRIDLDAVAKGAALDHLGAALARVLPGVPALLNLGESSTLAIGDPDGGGWVLAVKSSDPDVGELATLRLRDRALSVSSSLGSYREIAGQKVSHIIDPRTGATVEGTVEAVVIADRATRADGWSTGLLVLGARRSSIRLVEKAGLEAYLFDSSGRTVSSENWESYLAESGL